MDCQYRLLSRAVHVTPGAPPVGKVKLGWSLTAFTVTEKVAEVDAVPSLTTTVMLATPLASATGV